MPQALRVDLHHLARFTNITLAVLPVGFLIAGTALSFYIHFLTVATLFLLVVNIF